MVVPNNHFGVFWGLSSKETPVCNNHHPWFHVAPPTLELPLAVLNTTGPDMAAAKKNGWRYVEVSKWVYLAPRYPSV